MKKWDDSFDFIVVGSGGGGMMAAILAHDKGQKTLIVEKNTKFGGTTALSGGALWIPNNPLMQRDGVDDSIEQAQTYMTAIIGDESSKARQAKYLKVGPEMIEYLEKNTEVKFQRVPGYADYYPEKPGGNSIGRTIEAIPFNKKRLGDWHKLMNPAIWPILNLMPLTGKEYHKMAIMGTTWIGKKQMLKSSWRIYKDRLLGRSPVSLGQALIGMLALSVKNRQISMWLNAPVKDLIYENERVAGVIINKNGRKIHVKATKGVLLATGGFAHNQKMREQYMPQPATTKWTLANKTNEGDGINMGLKLDADTDLMDDAWWGPVSILNDKKQTPFFHVSERAQPGAIMVDTSGKRFVNEAKPYAEMGHIIYRKNAENEGGTIPCFFIFDRTFRRNYTFGIKFPGIVTKHDIESGYFTRANTIGELAHKMGIDADNLAQTIHRFNDMARHGKDEDFGKGDSVYDRYYGDPSVQPNPCLLPIVKPPFYAAKMYPGDLGTKGGLVTNEKAEVLRKNGSVIQGLYATGNTTASVMGHTYPGAGATIGASMAFGYVAACEIAQKN